MLDNRAQLVSALYDAALEPGLWPAAVQSVVDAFDAMGGCYLVFDKSTGSLRSANMVGPCRDLQVGYVDHFAPVDQFRRLLDAEPPGNWIRLEENLTDDIRRSNEWYNDFVLPSRIGDAIGARLFDDGQSVAMFGIQEEIGRKSIAAEKFASLRPVLDAFGKAARLNCQLDHIGWKSSIALRALERIATAVIVTDGAGHVIECNGAAERIIRLEDGLTVRQGLLATRRVFETSKLTRLIAAATAQTGEMTAGHMLVVRSNGRAPYALTVMPLGAELAVQEKPLAMVLAADPDEHTPSQKDLAEFFGFSPAEGRLAAALMEGRKLTDIAQDGGARITTLRTQLSSMLKKVGVERQADLVRVLAGTRLIDTNPRR